MINYYLLTKPKIVLGNLVTLAAGFLLASKGTIDFLLFFETLFGLSLIMASACVFNNYIDRQMDKKMERTKNRALVTGLISPRNALLFATLLEILGTATLYFFTNLLTVYVAAFGFFVYVILYSLWKRHTIYGTAIGSVAGAIPPVVGYCAVSNHFDMGATILFTLLVLWQMPHFFAIALYHFDDYSAAGIPVLPIVKGISRTKIHMIIYVISFVLAAVMLTFFNYTGYIYLAVTTLVGLAWIWLSMQGFKNQNDQLWGKKMYQLSLLMIISLCLVIPFDIVS
ncbi:heme o synthase [Parachlamydia acanthamoebae]|uniref:Protoheme IX farnesyltransferase n=2 Tax=Parachlamydia acanthamoebae TaxID=83552 RepID=F8KUU2_PARAV|nr:heme o synthase [Parachlamydia acanthamoebae]KIA76526.1 Protoheme IX farnesyltransferase [Parachlamydia acanthamoebae]CCB85007.1 protoheme IX farnesyltransferase [Parachlamydia acanthamoebae UV-7]